MVDLSAWLRTLAGHESGPILLPEVPRVGLGHTCVVGCTGCAAPRLRGIVQRESVRRALCAQRGAGAVLLAGADPLAMSGLGEAVEDADALGLEVELLTPGALLSPQRAASLAALPLSRVRVAVDPSRWDFDLSLEAIDAAATAGLPVDIQLAAGVPQASALPLLRMLTRRGAARLVLAEDDCRLPSTRVSRRLALEVVSALLVVQLTTPVEDVALCVEGEAFAPGLLVRALEALLGREVGREAGRCFAMAAAFH